jgi:tRNA pseudouridine13 synthase
VRLVTVTTTADTAEAIGLTGFAVDSPGIGGILKARVQDFRVEEIATKISLDPKGRFTAASITLTNWETNRFINRLAKNLSISRNRIFFAGTKDKRAITKQLFIIDAPPNKVENVEIPDVDIQIVGRTHQKLGFGNHRGNRFTIIARGCADENGEPLSDEEALLRVENIKDGLAEKLGEGLFPNWIGPQRFGRGRPVTPVVGRHVIAEDWEKAAMAYLTMTGQEERIEASTFRNRVLEEGISAQLLEEIPSWLGFEADIMRHLVEKPGDWIGAFRRLPNNLQLMTVHALQSVAFNRTLQARIDNDMPISVPIEGDIVGRVDEKGQLDVSSMVKVDDRILPRLARNCRLGRLVVTGQLPGGDYLRASSKIGKIEDEVLADMGLAGLDWQVKAIGRLSTKGTRRPLVTTFDDLVVDCVPVAELSSLDDRWQSGPSQGAVWHAEGACIRFRFTLSSGSYATTLLREFMHCPLNQI